MVSRQCVHYIKVIVDARSLTVNTRSKKTNELMKIERPAFGGLMVFISDDFELLLSIVNSVRVLPFGHLLTTRTLPKSPVLIELQFG